MRQPAAKVNGGDAATSHHLLQLFPLRTIANNLKRTSLGELPPGVEQSEQALFLGEASDEERAFAGTLFRAGSGSTKLGFTTILSAGKPDAMNLLRAK